MNNGIFLLLGTNLGDRMKNLSIAREHLESYGCSILNISSVYKTAAWGKTDQPDFYNQVLKLKTPLSPRQLLELILNIEHTMGRARTEKWGPRLIDIDILFYDTVHINEPDLVIPHPGIPHRNFTLQPLNEIAPEFIHPLLHKSVTELLKVCDDQSHVEVLMC